MPSEETCPSPRLGETSGTPAIDKAGRGRDRDAQFIRERLGKRILRSAQSTRGHKNMACAKVPRFQKLCKLRGVHEFLTHFDSLSERPTVRGDDKGIPLCCYTTRG
jgi:hypothetical protein